MRTFWQRDFPTGDPTGGPAYGQRQDPGSVKTPDPSTTGTIAAGAGGLGMLLNFMGMNRAAEDAITAGNSQAAADNYAAAQLRQNAGQAVAASQRDAINEDLKTQLMASRAVALAAAGGGGITGSAAKVVGDISGYGAYRRANAIYDGEEKARVMLNAATGKDYDASVARAGGQQRADAYNIQKWGNVATGGLSMFQKYGQGGFVAKQDASTGPTDGWGDLKQNATDDA